jgi:alpha-beta hydrolase superfamily lysophospholipase
LLQTRGAVKLDVLPENAAETFTFASGVDQAAISCPRSRRPSHSAHPLIAFGHSMGSALTQSHLQNHGDLLAGAILCGTMGSMPGFDDAGYETVIATLHAMSTGAGARAPSPLFGELLSPTRRSPGPSPVPPVSSGRRATPRSCARSNPTRLCGKPFSNSMTYSVLKGLHDLWPGKESRVRVDLPILIVAGTDDPVGRKTRTIQELITRYMRQGHLALAYRFYAGGRHEILNEVEKDQVQSGRRALAGRDPGSVARTHAW